MLQPRAYQLKSIERAQTHNLLLADDCGLGKTLTAIEAAKRLMYDDPYNRTLIVCPKKVREQWVDQIQAQGQVWPIYVLDNSPADLAGVHGWFITHYDALDKATYLTKYVWSVMIADEAHRLRSKNNKWTKAIKRIIAARYIALTATPMDRYPSEYWSILDFLQVQLPRFNGFKARYEVYSTNTRWPVYMGTKNLSELQTILARVMIKHVKADVAPELPPHVIIPTSVAMSPKQEAAFDAVDDAEDIIVPVEGITPLIIQNALVKLVRLQQIGTDPSLLDIDAPSGKFEWLDEFLSDHAQEKVVVFTRFRHTALCLARRYSAALVVGGQEGQGLDLFKKGAINVLVGTIAGMGIGLDLPMATHSVFLDMEWSTLQMQQAYDRIHRLGITETKFTHLLLANRVDVLIYTAVQKKWTEIELVQSFLKRGNAP